HGLPIRVSPRVQLHEQLGGKHLRAVVEQAGAVPIAAGGRDQVGQRSLSPLVSLGAAEGAAAAGPAAPDRTAAAGPAAPERTAAAGPAAPERTAAAGPAAPEGASAARAAA